MMGSNTLSCSCAASLAVAMTWSVPMTWKHTWFTTSGMTGFIFPGIMDDPGAIAGSFISPKPHRGPEANKRKSLQIFETFTATRRMMFEKSKNEPVLLDASMKSLGDVSGSSVNKPSSATASSAKPSCAQILVPIAVPPRLTS